MIHNKGKFLLGLGPLALVMLLSGSLLTLPAYAVTRQVNNGVACSDVTGNPYCTIGAAVAAANAGDTIHVYSGNYAETVTLDGPCDLDDSITVQVEAAPDSDGDPTPSPPTPTPTPPSPPTPTPPSPSPPIPVGGIIVPVSRLELLAPWVGLAALAALAALTVALIRRPRA